MSTTTISMEEFPTALDSDVAVGNQVTLKITGFVSSIMGDFIDVSSMGNKDYALGDTTVTIKITKVER